MPDLSTLDVLDLSDAMSEYQALGWSVLTIRPADDPYEAVVRSPHGETVCLRRTPIVISRLGDNGDGHTGRASMIYRDLIPGRWDGRFVASHIAVPDGGEVPDDVHHHEVDFQFLAVRSGWVDVLYEGQGDVIRMQPGDIVLQPPGIRHRVLATSPGFDIVELGCPADHLTTFDHEMTLPNGTYGDHLWGGQRFVFSSPAILLKHGTTQGSQVMTAVSVRQQTELLMCEGCRLLIEETPARSRRMTFGFFS